MRIASVGFASCRCRRGRHSGPVQELLVLEWCTIGISLIEGNDDDARLTHWIRWLATSCRQDEQGCADCPSRQDYGPVPKADPVASISMPGWSGRCHIGLCPVRTCVEEGKPCMARTARARRWHGLLVAFVAVA